MKIQKQMLMNDYPTKRGEILDSSCFGAMVEQFHEGAIEVDIEHDPRNAPVGRVVSAKLIPLPDGHVTVEGEVQLFEKADYEAPYPLQNIRLRPKQYELKQATLRIDENYYLNADARKDAEEAANQLGVKLQIHGKNSMEPPTWLTIALAFGLGAFAKDFFGEFGKDAYKLVKTQVMGLYRKYRNPKRDNLILFEFYTVDGQEQVLVSVIFSNPTEADFEQFLRYGIPFLDVELPPVFRRGDPIHRLAFSFKDSEIKLLYAVRKDGLPLFPSVELKHRFALEPDPREPEPPKSIES